MLPIMQTPAATRIAFYPQDNNVLAIGRDDSKILIYNARSAKVDNHTRSMKRVSGLAFSNDLNVLVSSGADAQWSSLEHRSPMQHSRVMARWCMPALNMGLYLYFDASDFQLYCRINPTSHLSPTSSLGVCPLVVAAHPREPNQFAAGLKDGAVIVFEPPISAGKWCMLTADENGSGVKCLLNPKLISENSEHENYA
ncbi:hypothetical protein SADUNF_Sadunf06G0208000 [Salix dunnii]|uniref:Uncharacterized protein n=1 Tax=Salix dunnii TaxID=1413687 RepID=A0A835K5W6_9ROSI|nr:hypothetical protein SADUNF_Sadunf06G0208000 [Salix dunnii]